MPELPKNERRKVASASKQGNRGYSKGWASERFEGMATEDDRIFGLEIAKTRAAATSNLRGATPAHKSTCQK